MNDGNNPSSFWNDARRVVNLCDELILCRSRVADKEDFARLVIQNLFGDGAVDLLSLRPQFDEVHAEALNRLNGLVGFESSVFKIIYSSDTLLDDFIRIFTHHAVSSRASPPVIYESIYVWLLAEYLGHILPTDETRLSFLRNANWLSAPSRSVPQWVSSSRKLLRAEVIAASSPLDYGMRSSISLRNVYPRLVRFLRGLVVNLTALQSWPSIAQCEVVRIVVHHYNEFILRDTSEDADVAALKLMLGQSALLVVPLRTFLDRLLTNWPLNASYITLIELWMSLCYFPSLESASEERRRLFVETSTMHFISSFEIIVQRVLDSDCVTLFDSRVLNFLEDNVFGKACFQRIFADYRTPIAEYLENVLGKLVRFRSEQKKLAGTDQSNSLFVKMARFLANLSNYPSLSIESTEYHIRIIEPMLCAIRQQQQQSRFNDSTDIHDIGNNSSMLSADGQINSGPSASTPICAIRAADILRDQNNRRYQKWHELSPIVHQHGHQRQQGTFAGGDATESAQPKSTMPDYQVDPWTKMLFLTPSGRAQVLNRRSTFDFKRCSQQIAETFPHVRRWEISSLAKWLHNLSVRYSNCWLVNYLRMHQNDSAVSRKLAHILLSAPSPPRYVPVFSRFVPQHPHRLNLRIFANVHILVLLYVLLYIIYTLLCWVF